MKSTRLTVYLLRDIAIPDQAIDPTKHPASLDLNPSSGLVGRFYYDSRPPTTPAWVNFVRPILPDELPQLSSSSSSGLLVTETAGRFVAITFGYGRGLLNMSKIERRFGLRVALNRIDPSQIRSLDTNTFEDLVVRRSTQVSKSSELPSFGIDISRDLLRAVTGEPRDNSIFRHLSGADALVVSTQFNATDLSKLLADLVAAFGEDSYKAQFEWIDNLSLVLDDATVNQLNDMLIEQLKTGDTSTTHAAMPEAIRWEDIDTFKIGGTRNTEYEDLDLDRYLSNLNTGRADITLAKLESRRVGVRFTRNPSDWDQRWTLYHCLISEQRLDSGLFVLIEGQWFAVAETLAQEVDAFVDGLEEVASHLVESLAGESEPDYNARLSASSPSSFLLFDRELGSAEGAATSIELCDVLSLSGEFIHIKRRSRSSTLSHLFAQGSVSATTFLGDLTFRSQMRNVIERLAPTDARADWLELIPEDDSEIDRSRYSVGFVVLTDSSRAGRNWLPFFSKLNLMQCSRQLRNLGFSVRLSRVTSSTAS